MKCSGAPSGRCTPSPARPPRKAGASQNPPQNQGQKETGARPRPPPYCTLGGHSRRREPWHPCHLPAPQTPPGVRPLLRGATSGCAVLGAQNKLSLHRHHATPPRDRSSQAGPATRRVLRRETSCAPLADAPAPTPPAVRTWLAEAPGAGGRTGKGETPGTRKWRSAGSVAAGGGDPGRVLGRGGPEGSGPQIRGGRKRAPVLQTLKNKWRLFLSGNGRPAKRNWGSVGRTRRP